MTTSLTVCSKCGSSSHIDYPVDSGKGVTRVFIECGHSQELDGNGNPYTPAVEEPRGPGEEHRTIFWESNRILEFSIYWVDYVNYSRGYGTFKLKPYEVEHRVKVTYRGVKSPWSDVARHKIEAVQMVPYPDERAFALGGYNKLKRLIVEAFRELVGDVVESTAGWEIV